jgi:spore germination protein KC
MYLPKERSVACLRHSKAFGISLCCLVMLQGCRSDYKDIDRRQFVVAMGVDKGKSEGLMVTMKGAIPQAQNPGSATSPDTFDNYDVSATSIGQAIDQVKQQFFLEPDYTHMKAVIFSEEFAKQEVLSEYIDFFIRRRDFQDIAEVAIAANAKDIVELHQKGERTAGDNLFMKFGEGIDTEYTPAIEMQQIYKYTRTPGFTLYCPILTIENNKIIARETALFDKYDRMKLKLNKEETLYFNLMKAGLYTGFIPLGPKNTIGVGIKNGKVKFNIKKQGVNLLCDVHVKIEAIIEETDLSHYTSKDYQEMATKKLNNDISGLLLKLQENQVDPLFLSLKYWSTNSKFNLSEQWLTNEYPSMKFQMHTDVKVVRTGTLKWK